MGPRSLTWLYTGTPRVIRAESVKLGQALTLVPFELDRRVNSQTRGI